MQADPVKTKRRNYTIIEKLKIVKECDNSSVSKIAQKYHVSERNIRRWKDNQLQFKKIVRNRGQSLIKRLKKAKPLEKPLYTWFLEARLRRIPISGPIIQAKALELSKEMGLQEKFVASSGWLNKWKTRHGIRQSHIYADKICADEKAADKFRAELAQKIIEENLTLAQIFNADETGLNFKMLPNRTSTRKDEYQTHDFKGNKDRLTIMVCSNADGSLKLPLVVIGKYRDPRALKNITKSNLPVHYAYQISAWMDTDTFESWFKDKFVPRVTSFLRRKGLPVKAILLLDNAPCHLSDEILSVNDIKTYYLPPNTTALIQPMDQGIIENIKRRYKARLLMSILNQQERNIDVMTYLKSITIAHVICWISDAWNEITESTILKSWKNILPKFLEQKTESYVTDQDLLNILHRIKNYEDIEHDSVQEWIFKADNIFPDLPSNKEIIEMANTSNEDDSVDNVDIEEESISPADAISAANTLLLFLEKSDLLHYREGLQKLKDNINDITNS